MDDHPTPDRGLVLASGGVVFRPASGGTEVLVVHRPRYRDWTFPKGKDDPTESPEQAAVREVEEETGYRCRIVAMIGETRYTTSRHEDKLVRYFAMRPTSVGLTPTGEADPEVDEIRWVPLIQAAQLLTYPRDRDLLDRLDLDGMARTGTLYLVRHSAAGSRSHWVGDDRLRPLSGKGRRQAEALVEVFARAGIERLLTSPYLRCRQTLEPPAAALGLPVEDHDALAEDTAGSEAVMLLEKLIGSNALLCSHGDVIPAVLDRLARRGMELESPFECRKGSTWVIEVESGTFTRARYLPPPPV